MAEQHGRARLGPAPGALWLKLLIYPWTLVALHHNIWIMACNVPGKYPLSIKAFIYLSWTLNILVFNTVVFDLIDLLVHWPRFLFFFFPLFLPLPSKCRVEEENYLWQGSQI